MRILAFLRFLIFPTFKLVWDTLLTFFWALDGTTLPLYFSIYDSSVLELPYILKNLSFLSIFS